MSGSITHTPNMSSDSGDEDKSVLVSPEIGDLDSMWVKEPTCNDVLCGRGGSINSHPGNERFRTLVEKRKRVYLTARFKREKRLIASSIVSEIRALDPPGRFLTRDGKTGRWRDIGDEKARDKTSQALRENAPSIRAEIETEINEHHAEMQRAEGEDVAKASHPPPYPAYGAQGWGYTAYYGHPPPPPPHAYGHPPPAYPGYWGHAPPPPPHYAPHPPHPSPYTQATSSTPYPTSPPKSALEQTVDLVASSADSIRQWTQKSFSFGTGMLQTTNSGEGHDSVSRADTASSKPIVYVHDDGTKKRRMVKFREDQSFTSASRRRPTKRHNASASLNGNSLVDGEGDEEDYEPQDLRTTENSPTGLMNSFANNFLSSIGSWDAVSIMCGHEQSDDRIPFPRSRNQGDENEGMEHVPDEDMVEWEGQEVQLMDNRMGGDSSDRESTPDRMPPPPRRNGFHDQASSVGFSSLGSCHSWLPDQISATASYFGGGSRGEDSMDMDYSAAGTENFSAAGSIGGSSLTKVFEHEALDDGLQSPHMTHHALQAMPSWERHVRSRSPLSLGGEDDESLISRTSSKLSDHGISVFPTGSVSSMHWETRE